MTFGFRPPFVVPWHASGLQVAAERGFRSQGQPDEEGNRHTGNRITDEFANHLHLCYPRRRSGGTIWGLPDQARDGGALGMQFEYRRMEGWPPLAWLAEVKRGGDTVAVHHGRWVETTPEWFAEATWAGSFQDGDFDETDIVSGSGARIRGRMVTFVSPGSTVDRLVWLTRPDGYWVSNSAPCLMRAADGTFDPAYRHYLSAFFSIIKGLDGYVDRLPSDVGDVHFTYFDNLSFDGAELRIQPKPCAHREFATFSDFFGFLQESFESLVDNMGDKAHSVRYRLLGMLSTGYDSTTVTALAKPFGLDEVICYRRAGDRDFASHIAANLGVRPIEIGIDEWRGFERPEIPFISANGIGEELHIRPAQDHLAGRVLLTGFHGDKAWDKNTPYTGTNIMRGDPSGGGLSEYRLIAGCLHCPVPFWGARQAADMKRINHLEEMAPWDIGGDYNRPICRRIVEGAGVPREAFGMEKSWASRWIVIWHDYLTESSRNDYLDWIGAHRTAWLRRGRLPPYRGIEFDRRRKDLLDLLSAVFLKTPGIYRSGIYKTPPFVYLTALTREDVGYPPTTVGVRKYVYPWAVDRAKSYYREF